MTIRRQNKDVTQTSQTCTYTLTPPGASVPRTLVDGNGGRGSTRRKRLDGDIIGEVGGDSLGASGSGNGAVGYSIAAMNSKQNLGRRHWRSAARRSPSHRPLPQPCIRPARRRRRARRAGGPGTVAVSVLRSPASHGVATTKR